MTLRLLSFIRSVFPGCSLLGCLRFRGFGADDGSRTRNFHLGRVTLRLLSFIRVRAQPRLLGRAGLGAYLSVPFMSVC